MVKSTRVRDSVNGQINSSKKKRKIMVKSTRVRSSINGQVNTSKEPCK